MIKKIFFPKEYEFQSHRVLKEALTHLKPYFSWRKADLGGASDIEERYQHLPFLTKNDLREFGWEAFALPDYDWAKALKNGEISLVQTSGTTEDKVTNVWDQGWWNKTEQRSWEYNENFKGLFYGKSREAILTSPHNTGVLSDTLNLSFTQRKLDRFLYLNEKSNPAFWDDALLERMRQELLKFKPEVLEVNPAYLGILSQYLARTGKEVFQPKIIVFSFENYSQISKNWIQKVFQSPIANSFGSTEAGCVLMECGKGMYHQNLKSCRIDFQPFNPAFGPENIGRIFVTSFDNPWRVLIRFDIGDLVRLAPNQECSCGKKGGYLFESIEGRLSNLTFSTSGKCITPRALDNAVSSVDGILNYQLTQKNKTDYHLGFVLQPHSDADKTSYKLREILIGLYGSDSSIMIEPVPLIQTESSGKYRPSRCLMPFDSKQLFI